MFNTTRCPRRLSISVPLPLVTSIFAREIAAICRSSDPDRRGYGLTGDREGHEEKVASTTRRAFTSACPDPSSRRLRKNAQFLSAQRHLSRACRVGSGQVPMPYTNRSLAVVWLIAFGLFFLAGSGVATGWWLLLMIPVALAAPAVLFRNPVPAVATARERPRVVSTQRSRSPLDLSGMDLHRWEDEGGAHPLYLRGTRIVDAGLA